MKLAARPARAPPRAVGAPEPAPHGWVPAAAGRAARGSANRTITEPERCARTDAAAASGRSRSAATRPGTRPTAAGREERARSWCGPSDNGTRAAGVPGARGRRARRVQGGAATSASRLSATASSHNTAIKLSKEVFCLKAKPTPAAHAGPQQATPAAGLDVAGRAQTVTTDAVRRTSQDGRPSVAGRCLCPAAGPAPGGEGEASAPRPQRCRAPGRSHGRPPAGHAAPPGQAQASPAVRRGGGEDTGCTG